MPLSVTFLCPHGAAKSTAAAAYFEREAAAVGLDVTVATAGTDPDDEVMPEVRAHLEGEGLHIHAPPRPVTAADLAADVVVSIGCDLDGLVVVGDLRSWDHVPLPSADFDGSMSSVAEGSRLLANELAP